MNCKNKYCPIEYNSNMKVCQDCDHKPITSIFNDIKDSGLPSCFKDLFGTLNKK